MKASTYLTVLVLIVAAAVLSACGPFQAVGGPGSGLPDAPPDSGPSAALRGLANVTDFEIYASETEPYQVQLIVRGMLPDSCTFVEETTQMQEGSTFFVSIHTLRPAGSACSAEAHSFETLVSLAVSGLGAGEYAVNVNGVLGTFTRLQNTSTPEPAGQISGVIWHDLCALQGGEGTSVSRPTVGCVPAGDSFRANGVFETGEPGLGGLLVRLGAGACPSSNTLDEAMTGADGAFSFHELLPGSYCVSVDSLAAHNASVLLPGEWTYPAGSGEHAEAGITVVLSSGEKRADIRFGWDYQFLPLPPAPAAPTPAPSPTPIPTPCNQARFVSDVTVPDNTPYSPGAAFTKVWRLQNIGTCTWTVDYDLVFVNGNAMTDKVTHPLTKSVKPGESIDLSVKMTAPYALGNYKSSWMLRSADGKLFGLGSAADQVFWALIKVISPNENYVYDFAANYCLATWTSDTGALPCPGTSGGTSGFVSLLDRPTLENRTENEPALWMQPNHHAEGWITGEYPPIIVQEGDRFRAWIGCLAESKGCDVTFSLLYRADGGKLKKLAEWRETYDGEISAIDLDLSSLARRSVEFTLAVEINNKKYESANGFWFVPRIENVKPKSGPVEQDGPAVQSAKQVVAAALGTAPSNLEVTLLQGPVAWTDSCLNVVLPGYECVAQEISGYRIILEFGGKNYEARTNMTGSIVYWFFAE